MTQQNTADQLEHSETSNFEGDNEANSFQEIKVEVGKGAVSELEEQINFLKSIQNSKKSTNADKISATKAIQSLRKQEVIDDDVPLSAMSRADIDDELRRCSRILKANGV